MKISGPVEGFSAVFRTNMITTLRKEKVSSTCYRINIKDASFRIEDVNVLTKSIKLVAADGRVIDLDINDFVLDSSFTEVAILSDG